MPFQVNWSEPMQHGNMQIYMMTAKIQMLGKIKLFTFNKYFNNALNIQPVKYAIKKKQHILLNKLVQYLQIRMLKYQPYSVAWTSWNWTASLEQTHAHCAMFKQLFFSSVVDRPSFCKTCKNYYRIWLNFRPFFPEILQNLTSKMWINDFFLWSSEPYPDGCYQTRI